MNITENDNNNNNNNNNNSNNNNNNNNNNNSNNNNNNSNNNNNNGNNNNRKTIASIKRSKYKAGTKARYFLNKTKFNYFSFASSFAICNVILVYYLLAYKSKAKQGIIIQEDKFHGLGLLQFQNK